MKSGAILAVGTAVLLLGWVTESFGYNSAFPRSGALLVAAVVALVFFEIDMISGRETKRKIENDAKFPIRNREVLNDGVIVRTGKSNIISGGTANDRSIGPDEEVRITEISVEAQIDEIRRLAAKERAVRLSEAGLLVIGTLVWGYGDLVANQSIHCGEWICSS